MRNSLFIFFVALMCNFSFGQCIIDNTIQTTGFHPDTGSFLRTACYKSHYEDYVQIFAPDTVVVGGNPYKVNYVRLDSVSNLPSGIQYSTNPTTGVMQGGERGCISFLGVMNAPVSVYNFVVYYTANFELFGGTSLNFQAPYKIQVQNGATSFQNIADTTCQFSPYFFNGSMLDQTGLYTDTLSNFLGCDSIIQLQLYVHDFDTAVMFFGNEVHAPSGYENYLWFDCLNNAPIGWTDSILPMANHTSVYVRYENVNCQFQSSCLELVSQSIIYQNTGFDFFVSPNPVSRVLNCNFDQNGPHEVIIFDAMGVVRFQQSYSTQQAKLDLLNLSSGSYLLMVIGPDLERSAKLILKN